jgi:protein-L-isoaspartate O-methyltransferase
MADSVEQVRRWYAEELRFTARVSSPTVVDAFATVPRERFVGPGPWLIKSPMNLAEYWVSEDADPCHVYHDVLIALDEARGINNGQPSLWAYLFNQIGIIAGEHVLHLGCGTGYYTAIAAELVGPTGKVTQSRSTRRLLRRREPHSCPGHRSQSTTQTGLALRSTRSISSLRALAQPIHCYHGLMHSNRAGDFCFR